MKPIYRILMGAFLFVSRVEAISPVTAIAAEGQWKDDMYAVTPDSGEHLRAMHWDPEKSEPPLSIKKAISIARNALKKMVGDSYAHFRCEDVKITQENRHWYYVVTFWSTHPQHVKKMEGSAIAPAILPFVVYLDGAVEIPWKKTPNKAPEPTTTSVTPPANER